MAITKKFKVSFDVTAVMPTEVQKAMESDLLAFIKQVGKGEVTPDPLQRGIIIQFLTHGMEGAMSLAVRRMLREGVKEMHQEFATEDFRFSPATVREVF